MVNKFHRVIKVVRSSDSDGGVLIKKYKPVTIPSSAFGPFECFAFADVCGFSQFVYCKNTKYIDTIYYIHCSGFGRKKLPIAVNYISDVIALLEDLERTEIT